MWRYNIYVNFYKEVYEQCYVELSIYICVQGTWQKYRL